jgi:hypothetical protein
MIPIQLHVGFLHFRLNMSITKHACGINLTHLTSIPQLLVRPSNRSGCPKQICASRLGSVLNISEKAAIAF